MSRICIWGASLNKVDDEAQIVAGVGLIRSRFPSTQFTFLSQYGKRLVDFLAREGIAAEVVDTPNPAAVVRAMIDADMFLILGGVLFEAPMQALRGAVLVSLARACRRPVVAWQLSMFPYTTRWAPVVFRWIFERMDLICAREPIAREIMTRLGVSRPVSVFADARLTLEPSPPAAVRALLTREGIDPDRPLIGLTTRHVHAAMPGWVRRTHSYGDEIAERANDALAAVAAHLASLGQVVAIPMHPTYEEDLRVFEAVTRHTKAAGRLRLLGGRLASREIMGILAHCDLVLACRLGSAVLAAATGTPVVAIAYEPRMLEVMQRLGLADRAFDWRRLNAGAIIAAIDESWSAPRSRTSSELVEGLKAEARASADALGGLLS